MLKNITARPITIKQGVKAAVIEAANAVPQMLAPKEIGEGIEAVSKSAHRIVTKTVHRTLPVGGRGLGVGGGVIKGVGVVEVKGVGVVESKG